MSVAQKKEEYEYSRGQGGLTQAEAEARIKEYGSNELDTSVKISIFELFFGQFKDFITWVLIAAIGASWFLGETADALTILIIIGMNALLGFIQEYRTERSLEALKELSAPHARVLRDGMEKDIAAREVVPGDVLLLEAGDRVAADCRLIESINLQADESILTGESSPVDKSAAMTYQGGTKLNSKEMLFMGTTLTMGRGKAIVTQTGMATEMGKIAHMIQTVESDETPLKKRLNKIGKELVLISLVICLLIIGAGLYHGESVYNMLLSGISLAVAAIPEGLPAIVTVSLAIGVQRMLKRQALIRRLPAVETLGSVNIICSDKTGTLTENRMTVKEIYLDNKQIEVSGHGRGLEGKFTSAGSSVDPMSNHPLKQLLTIGSLCNNAVYTGKDLQGDPTEVAILIASLKGGIKQGGSAGYRRLMELPFDSDRKLMSVICQNEKGEYYLFTKGAPDKIISRSNQEMTQKGLNLMTAASRERLLNINDQMASRALRVLAFAYRRLEQLPRSNDHELEQNMIFVGLEGMIDPPRPEAVKAVKSCIEAGIRPVMITGDHRATALAIARELGMNTTSAGVLTGNEIEGLSNAALDERIEKTAVFARVTPAHKLRIVQAFKRKGNIVAMTGDGVNDAPALKEADIGVAMGKGGTDVAKEAASMVLLDDNFATIVAAIEEGRMIFDNIRKFIRYLLACNLGEILMMGVAAFLGMPLPLVPIQILWLNLVTDGLPALALGVDPPEANIMKRPPRRQNESIFSGGLGTNIFISGALIGASSLLSFSLVLYQTNGDLAMARTTAFATLIVAEILYSFECRSEHTHVFKVGFLKNPYLLGATLSSFLLTFVVIYHPFLSKVFKTVGLGLREWTLVMACALVEFLINSLIPFREK